MIQLTTILHFTILLDWILSWAFSLLLFLVKVPRGEYSRKLIITKTIVAVCYLVCGVIFGFAFIHPEIPDYNRYVATMMLIVTMISASSLSFSLTNLINEGSKTLNNFLLSSSVIVMLGFLLVYSTITGPTKVSNIVLSVCVIWQIIQCTTHIFSFSKIFKEGQSRLDNYYDEEEDIKLRWIRFCYAVMMIIELLMIICLFIPEKFMFVYLFAYAVFLVYFVSNFLSFLSCHKPLLDAFADFSNLPRENQINHPFFIRPRGWLRKMLAEKKVTRQNGQQKAGISEIRTNAREMEKIGRNIEKWVMKKKYLDYDRSRQEIAEELGTTRENLQMYFQNVMGQDFRTWRTNLRINDAKVLLLEDKILSINLVAEKCGFSDRSNFHKQFTKIVGCSPKMWRDSNGNI